MESLNDLSKFSVLVKIVGPGCTPKRSPSSMGALNDNASFSRMCVKHTHWVRHTPSDACHVVFLLECSLQGLHNLAGCSHLEPAFEVVSKVRRMKEC